jgi:hypothetical protein
MPSPFPGMNPYLEQSEVWPDFHNTFLTESRAVLSAAVGEHYFIKLEVRLYLEALPDQRPLFLGRGDLGVTQSPGDKAFAPSAEPSVAAPVELELPDFDEQSEASLEILDRRSQRVVTVIELLSPSNKSVEKDRQLYLAKRKHLLQSRTNFVEIDLLRGGKRPEPPELPECDYYALVHRSSRPKKLSCWPVRLRERLPVVPIPLAPPDGELQLDLQAVLHRIYDAAKFGRYIYSTAPEPRLGPDDRLWANSILIAAGHGEAP